MVTAELVRSDPACMATLGLIGVYMRHFAESIKHSILLISELRDCDCSCTLLKRS